MERPPKKIAPRFIRDLIEKADTSTDEAKVKAALARLKEIQSKGGKAAQAKRREKSSNEQAVEDEEVERLLNEYVESLMERNMHLDPLGTHPVYIEELLKPHRID